MDLIIKTLTSVSYAIVDPTLALMLLIVGILFYMRNKKIAFMQKMVMGEILKSPLELTLSQIVLGILGGVFISLILSVLGVTFYENSAIEIVLALSIVLIFFKPKLFNFPYVASILGLISIVLSTIKNEQEYIIKVNITYLITFIAVIYFVQGILIIIDGKTGYIPVFTNRNNNILGGFAFKRYWILPISLFMVFTSMNSGVNSNISNLSWWPLIKVDDMISIMMSTALLMVPMYGMVGYDSVTFTKDKTKHTIISGITLSLYGVALLLLGQVAKYGLVMEIVAIILMPIFYRIIKYIEKQAEKKSMPLFISDNEGICILDVIPKSTAFKQGVRSGDKIIEVDGEFPIDEKEIFASLKNNSITTILKIKSLKGEIREHIIDRKIKANRFGIILVPIDSRNKEKYNVKEILDKIKTLTK